MYTEPTELSTKSPAFISYARRDQEFATRLAADLKAAGAEVWLDQLDIGPGRRWDLEIEQALRNCTELLVILSPAAVTSNNVMDEVSFALEKEKIVIPVFQADCDIPFRWRRLQYVDFRSNYARGLETLVTHLTSKIPLSEAQNLGANEGGIDLPRLETSVQEPELDLKRGRAGSEWAGSSRVLLVRTLVGQSAVWGVAVTVDGKRAVSASNDGTLKVWNLESGETLRTLEGHPDPVYGVVVTADGKRAVSASVDQTLKVWDLESGHALRTLKGHSFAVTSVTVTADGRRTVSASLDETLKVWDTESGRVLHTLEGHSDSVIGVAVTADGKRAVSASYDQSLKVWDLEGGRELRTLKGHSSAIYGVAVTADGKWAVSASKDKTLKVWDLEGGWELRTLEGHSSAVNGVAVTLDWRGAVSVSEDQTLKVWDLESGRVIDTLRFEEEVSCCAFVDRRRIVAGDLDGRIHLLSLEESGAPRAMPGAKG